MNPLQKTPLQRYVSIYVYIYIYHLTENQCATQRFDPNLMWESPSEASLGVTSGGPLGWSPGEHRSDN